MWHPVGVDGGLINLESREDCESAARDAVAWGFPRTPDAEEIERSYWHRIGPRVVFWYEPSPQDPSDMALHIAVHPEHRGFWGQRTLLRHYLKLGKRHGAKNLFSFPLDDVSGPILERLGWTPFDGGLVRNVEYVQ